MSWSLTVGSRRLVFGTEFSGLGLMRTPRVRPIVEFDAYGNARGDGRRLGRVYRRGQVVSLEVEARPDKRSMPAVWAELLGVWRADGIRALPGAQAMLTAPSGRSALGMPVDIDPNEEYRLFNMNRAVLSFECVDDLWYGPEEQTTTRLAPTFTGGLPVPATVPFVLGGGTGESDSIVQVGGDVAAWPVFEVRGPISDPWIDVPGVGRLVFRGQLAYDQVLQVDTRPWARWVKRDGAPFPGALSPAGARLSDMAMPPGSYRVIFGGYDPSGTSSLTVRVSPAFTSF